MYKPNYETLNATSADIVNAIFQSNTAVFDGAPTVSMNNVETFSAAWQYLSQYETRQNEFISALNTRIYYRIITSRLYMNPLARWKKGIMELGDTIEEIFVGLVDPVNFNYPLTADETAKMEFGNNPPNVKSAYHSINYRKLYPVDASYEMLQTAFVTVNGVTDMIIRIIESLYSSAAYDEELAMTYLLYRNALAGNIYSVPIAAVTKENMEDTAITIKQYSDTITRMHSDFNMSHTDNFTPKTSQILITTPKFNAIYGIKILAYAFNKEYAEFSGSQMMVSDMGAGDIARLNKLFAETPDYVPFTDAELATIKSIGAFLVDERFFQIWDNLLKLTYNYLGSGLRWKHWLHRWQTFSVSPFANAIMFTTETPAVTALTPYVNGVQTSAFTAYSNIAIEQKINFSVSATTTGGATPDVTFDWGNNGDGSSNETSLVQTSPSTATLTIPANTEIQGAIGCEAVSNATPSVKVVFTGTIPSTI